jgi:ATP-citrate lyase beta-subunit
VTFLIYTSQIPYEDQFSAMINSMPRKKLSEFRAKNIINDALGIEYKGWQLDEPSSYDQELVVKVDEGVKGRFKKGLVLLNVKPAELVQAVNTLAAKGYRYLIVEPMLVHEQNDEKYISFASDRNGWEISYTEKGGIDVELFALSIDKTTVSSDIDWSALANIVKIDEQQLRTLTEVCMSNYFIFMEINPYVNSDGKFYMLDTAVEVDDAAEYFVDSWKGEDLRQSSDKDLTNEELTVLDLDANSPASFNLSVLEPNGSVFLLLSGGGASVVVADEVYNKGYGEKLANYGEYSGNPNTEETYIYTKAVLQLLLRSNAPKKVLFIGGAVANFTDIAKTFEGVIKAIQELSSGLQEQNVKVFVRRGGPNQEKGLERIRNVLTELNLLGSVNNPDTPLTVVVGEALQEVS